LRQTMRNIQTRLSRLEEKTTGTGRLYVVEGPDRDHDARAFLQMCGYDIAPRDLIVYIQRFSYDEGPKLVSNATRAPLRAG
jgi:hypothetical protein